MIRKAAEVIGEYFGVENIDPKAGKGKIVPLDRKPDLDEIGELIKNERNTPSYNEEYKNTGLFRFYEKHGFEEIGQTRLLFKEL